MAEREAPGPDGVVTLDPPERLLALTVPGLLALRARRFPTALALSARSAQGWRDRLDYAQLVDRMEQMALALARLGLGPGGIVALLLTNDAGRECFLTALGCLRLGAAVSPINTRASDEDLGHALALLAPAIVVTRAEAGRVARLHPAARILLVDGAAEGHQSWPDPFERQGDAAGLPPPPTDPGTLGCLLFTSGTTARPKAVMHSHASMIGAACAVRRRSGSGRGISTRAAGPSSPPPGSISAACRPGWRVRGSSSKACWTTPGGWR